MRTGSDLWYNWDKGKSGTEKHSGQDSLSERSAMTKGQIDMEQLSVNPSIIDVTDIKGFSEVGAGVDIKPAYYDVILRVSPLVILKLLRWLLDNQYIKLSGKLTVSIRGRSYNYVQ